MTPCEALWLAVLEDAVNVIQRPAVNCRRREIVAAVEWMRSEARDDVSDFAVVCEVLELDAGSVRQSVLGVWCERSRIRSPEPDRPFIKKGLRSGSGRDGGIFHRRTG